jgi:hypothetical protein
MSFIYIVVIVLAALSGVGGITAAIYALGFFEYMGGKKQPKAVSISKQKLLEQILHLNSPELSYQIVPSEKTDLEIFWKIVDAEWQGIFAREKISKTYRAYMVLDEPRHTLRYWEALANVEWVAGAPRIHYRNEFFRGRILYQKSYGVQYSIKKDKTLGKVYEYSFDINSIRGPIKEKVEESGWEFVEVLKKKHAMTSSVATI